MTEKVFVVAVVLLNSERELECLVTIAGLLLMTYGEISGLDDVQHSWMPPHL